MSNASNNDAALRSLHVKADELAQKAEKLGAAMSRQWKVTAWMFGIICVVVACYLGYIYYIFQPLMSAEGVVNYASARLMEELPRSEQNVIEALQGYAPQAVEMIDVPGLVAKIPEQTDALAAFLKERGREIVGQQLEQQAGTLREKLPEYRQQLAERLRAAIPGMVARALPSNEEVVAKLPQLRAQLADAVAQSVPHVLDSLIPEGQTLADKLPELRAQLAAQIKASIPGLVERVLPTAEEVRARAPELRKLVADRLKESAPGLVAALMPAAEQARQQLPELRKRITSAVEASMPGLINAMLPATEEFKARIPEMRKQVAQSMKEAIVKMLDDLGPGLAELQAQLPEKRQDMARRLIAAAPDVMARIKPRLAELKTRMPAVQEQVTEALTQQAPIIADMLRDNVISVALPEARRLGTTMAMRELDAAIPELTSVVDQAVRAVVDQHMEDIRVLERDDLAKQLAVSFEEAAGPVLDEFSAKIEQAIAAVKVSLQELLQRKNSGAPLTKEEELELRYLQLWKTYWNVRMLEAERPQS